MGQSGFILSAKSVDNRCGEVCHAGVGAARPAGLCHAGQWGVIVPRVAKGQATSVIQVSYYETDVRMHHGVREQQLPPSRLAASGNGSISPGEKAVAAATALHGAPRI